MEQVFKFTINKLKQAIMQYYTNVKQPQNPLVAAEDIIQYLIHEQLKKKEEHLSLQSPTHPMLTIKELKEKIKDLPDELEVGTTGHYGELLECYNSEIEEVYTYDADYKPQKKRVFILRFDAPGPDPNAL